MEIRPYPVYHAQEVLPLYAAVGWTAYTDDREKLQRGFARSLLTLAAYEGEALIGLLRAVGDGETIVFVQDLLVHPAYQRRGIGAALLQTLLNRFPDVRQIELCSDTEPRALRFYTRCGFRRMEELGCCGWMK